MDNKYYLLATIDNSLIEIERLIELENLDKESIKFLVHNARRAINEITQQEQAINRAALLATLFPSHTN